MAGTFEERAKLRRQTMTAHVAHSKAEAIAFGRALESNLQPFERAEAIWSLVCRLMAARGGNAAELRFDRSVGRVERRGR